MLLKWKVLDSAVDFILLRMSVSSQYPFSLQYIDTRSISPQMFYSHCSSAGSAEHDWHCWVSEHALILSPTSPVHKHTHGTRRLLKWEQTWSEAFISTTVVKSLKLMIHPCLSLRYVWGAGQKQSKQNRGVQTLNCRLKMCICVYAFVRALSKSLNVWCSFILHLAVCLFSSSNEIDISIHFGLLIINRKATVFFSSYVTFNFIIDLLIAFKVI